ncbi:phospholipase A and acyltransferase 3-like [Sorex fumeus]|uniref:phospholipase A and acyltransferase 3-like n=1 Tax=Sorex fumeus TaxID=62283 RepID=UPI0024AE69FF|nr:phospholipase A and acyltransferase 3-like [Sorex fumeus]
MASNRIGPEPKPGELIEIFLGGGIQHWAVYVGDGYVVHVTDINTGLSGINLVSSVFGLSTEAVVKKELLSQVAVGKTYRVNNKYDQEYPPLPRIVERAEKLVGRVIAYNLPERNCENFSTLLRYGVSLSEQVEKKAKVITESMALFATAAVAVMVTLAFIVFRN